MTYYLGDRVTFTIDGGRAWHFGEIIGYLRDYNARTNSYDSFYDIYSNGHTHLKVHYGFIKATSTPTTVHGTKQDVLDAINTFDPKKILDAIPFGGDVVLYIHDAMCSFNSPDFERIGYGFGLMKDRSETYGEFENRVKDYIVDSVLQAGSSGVFASPKPSCTHEWKRYVGLMESFEYCSICDEKRK